MREGRHEHRGPHHHGEHRGPKGGRGRSEEDKKHFRSAQTFRRGRAVAFLERLEVKRTTLVQQLEQPEYVEIKAVISGELKATDAIIQEFIHMFELQEWQEAEPQEQQMNETTSSTEAAVTNNVETEESEATTVAPADATDQPTDQQSTEFNADSTSSTTSTSKSNDEQ
ncbi:hypothetical protein [Paenibacillus kandeliae]|uniref:hypothetical protein n=1 Tax=Paenibacillus kandeliae TaxID=3231269 RepID=UPI00345A4516